MFHTISLQETIFIGVFCFHYAVLLSVCYLGLLVIAHAERTEKTGLAHPCPSARPVLLFVLFHAVVGTQLLHFLRSQRRIEEHEFIEQRLF